MEKQAVVLSDGTDADVDRVRDRRARGGGPDLLRPRRPGPRPAGLGRRPRRDSGSPCPTWSSCSCCRCTPTTRPATGCRARSSCPSCRPTPTRAGAAASCAGPRVELRVPQRGDKRTLLETVERNAKQAFTLHKIKRASDLTARSLALQEMQDALDLNEAPLRIECYDVSNLQGTEVVASMVVFEDGLARKSEYRRFAVRGLDGQDDVASMHQVIRRRFSRYLEEREKTGELGDAPEDADDPEPAEQVSASGWHRPDHRPPREVRLPAEPGRRRRRPAAGRRRRGRDGRARHRGRRAVRAGQAAGGGLAAGRPRPGHPAAHQRGPLPAAAGARRGAPVRHHLPPAEAVEVDDHQRPRRRARAGRDPAQGAAAALRLAQAAPGRERRRDRRVRRASGRVRLPRSSRRWPATTTGTRDRPDDRRDTRRRSPSPRARRPHDDRRVPAAVQIVVRHRPVRRRPQHGGQVPGGPRLVRRRQPAAWAAHHHGRPRHPVRGRGRPDRRRRRRPQPGVLLRPAQRPARPRGPGRPARGCCSSRPATTSWSAASRTSGARTRCRATAGWSTASRASASSCSTSAARPTSSSTPRASTSTSCGPRSSPRSPADRTRRPAGHRRLVRLQVRPAGRRRPGPRLPVPAQPALGPELRPRTGQDAQVRDYVLSQPGAEEFLDRDDDLLAVLMPGYQREGKRYLTLAVGCTGGKHRSVAMTEQLADRLPRSASRCRSCIATWGASDRPAARTRARSRSAAGTVSPPPSPPSAR